jgi:ABC-type multidrug transport system ATPase subunit
MAQDSEIELAQNPLSDSNTSISIEHDDGPCADLGSADASFDFSHCTYSVFVDNKETGGKDPKKLVTDLSASIPPGTVLAVMGPSGAGKTTLLSMLMLDPVGGKPEGVVTLGGHPFTLALYQKHCAVVTQHDCLWWAMSTREHLASALDFYQPTLTGAARTAYLDELIEDMGLKSAEHTRAGNASFKGLSGGQKRRLSLAVALCKKPHVVFLDEPTSGLDAAAAASIMGFLKKVAEKQQISIFCTIHSPSAAVFAGFDRVLFLTGGCPAYLGRGDALTAYLEDAGEPPPHNTNPADHMLDLINTDFTTREKVDALIARWRATQPDARPTAPIALLDVPRAGFAGQVHALVLKHGRLVIKDPTLYLGRLVAFPLASTLFAIIFIEARARAQEQAQARVFLTFWMVAVPCMFILIACFALSQELVAVRREIKDGMYSVGAYVVATSLLQLPLLFLLGLVVLVPAAYPIANFAWEYFHVSWLVLSSTLLAFEAVAQLLSLARNPLLGMLQFMVTPTHTALSRASPLDALQRLTVLCARRRSCGSSLHSFVACSSSRRM